MLFFILASKVVAKTIIEFKELEQRNANDVCEDYQNNFVWEKKPCYVPSGKTCVYGTQSKEDREMATKRVNFYRQLTGLATIPQTNSIAYQNRSDQTALIMEENKFMNHYLPENLKELANLRQKHPEASLVELGEMLKQPIGKSGVNHRLKRIMEIAKEWKIDSEK